MKKYPQQFIRIFALVFAMSYNVNAQEKDECSNGEFLTMNDGYGDGWNGAALTINGVDYTMLSGYSESVCVDVE